MQTTYLDCNPGMRIWILHVQTLLLPFPLVLFSRTTEFRWISRPVLVSPPLLTRPWCYNHWLSVHARFHYAVAVALINIRTDIERFVVVLVRWVHLRLIWGRIIPHVNCDPGLFRTAFDWLNFHFRGENLLVWFAFFAVTVATSARCFHFFYFGIGSFVTFGTLPAIQFRFFWKPRERRIETVQMIIQMACVTLCEHMLVSSLSADAALI